MNTWGTPGMVGYHMYQGGHWQQLLGILVSRILRSEGWPGPQMGVSAALLVFNKLTRQRMQALT